MMRVAELLRGAPVAETITETLKAETAALLSRGVRPCLAFVRVGERKDDLAYERGAVKRCERVGIDVRRLAFPADVPQDELLREIGKLNMDALVHGILLFRPLPKHLDDAAVCAAIAPEKDVDGVTSASMASVYANAVSSFPPCTAEACLAMLKHYDVPMAGKRALIAGRSLVIGRPVAMLLLAENATVTIAHSCTRNLSELCREADILIAAAGRSGFIGAEHVHEGQVVIDVGIHANPDGTLCGDVRYREVEPVARAITPVPGGIGAVTTAVLCAHVVRAARSG